MADSWLHYPHQPGHPASYARCYNNGSADGFVDDHAVHRSAEPNANTPDEYQRDGSEPHDDTPPHAHRAPA